MATTQVQRRRGTDAENNSFTGAVGELTIDTTNNTIRVHDGTTVGGHVIPVMNSSDGVQAGTYPKVTVNKYGVVTAGSALSSSDISGISGINNVFVQKVSTTATPGIAYKKVVVNSNGLVVSASCGPDEPLAVNDIPSLPQSKITNLSAALDDKSPQLKVYTKTVSSQGVTLTNNAVNVVTMNNSLSITLPSDIDKTVMNQIVVYLNVTAAGHQLALGASWFFGGAVPFPDLTSIPVGRYNLYYEFDPSIGTNGAWVVGALKKGTI